MELSLFSRDVIAMSTAVALSHGMFDGVAMLGMAAAILGTIARAAEPPGAEAPGGG